MTETADNATAPRRKHRARRWVIGVLVGVVVIVTGLGLVVWFWQRSLIYFPDRAAPAWPTGYSGEDISLTTDDGLTLSAWLVKPAGEDRHIGVLFLHGNGGNRAGRVNAAAEMSKLGYTVLLLDYRGYGGNPGSPTEAGLASDARAGAAYLHEHGFPPDHTIYFGESLGTGVAIGLATTDEPAGIVLRSPFTSLADMARAQYAWLPSWLVRDKYDTLGRIPTVTAPVSVLYGTADSDVPPAQSEQVAAAAAHLFTRGVIEGAKHNDGVWQGEYVARQVDALAQGTVG